MSDLNSESVYKEICQSIRETDAISFKLLNLVPLGFKSWRRCTAVLQKNTLLQTAPPPVTAAAIVLLSLAGAAIVFGLHKWELRNIEKCRIVVINRAERSGTASDTVQRIGNEAEAGRGRRARAENLIYRVSMLIWLIPIVMLLI